ESRDLRHDDLLRLNGTIRAPVFRVTAIESGSDYILAGRQCHAIVRGGNRRGRLVSTLSGRVSRHLPNGERQPAESGQYRLRSEGTEDGWKTSQAKREGPQDRRKPGRQAG